MSKSKTQTRKLELEFDLPEFVDSDIDVVLNNNQLIIRAEKKTEKKIKRSGFLHDEKSQREFLYTTSLEGLKVKQFKREFNNGKLKVSVF